MKKTDYVFASAYIRSNERYLINREKAEQMLDCKTPTDVLKILQSMEYGDRTEPLSEDQFELLLQGEQRKVWRLILSVAPDQEALAPFQYPADYHNIKTLLKGEFLDVESEDLLLETGTIAPGKLKLMIRDRNFSDLTKEMKRGIPETIEQFSKTGDPQLIDVILDRACYMDMLEKAEEHGNSYVIGYIRLLIDTINLKAFVRLRQMGQTWSFFTKVFLPGGHIDEKVFVGGYEEALDQFAEKLLPFGLFSALHEGNEGLKRGGGFTTLEKACDNRLLDYVRQAKYVAFGLEPLAAYWLAKENEMKLVRIILAGKLASVPIERIRERLRETYV